MNEDSEIWIVIIQVNGDYDSGNVYSRQIVGSLFNDAYDNRNNIITPLALANVTKSHVWQRDYTFPVVYIISF